MIGQRNNGGEPHIQTITPVRTMRWAWFLWWPFPLTTGLFIYSLFYFFGQPHPNLDDAIPIPATGGVWIICAAILLRSWWRRWNQSPWCTVNLETGTTTFHCPPARLPKAQGQGQGEPPTVQTIQIGPVTATGRSTKSVVRASRSLHLQTNFDPDYVGDYEDRSDRSSRGFSGQISSPALGVIPVTGNFGAWPRLIQRLETLGAPADKTFRWWSKDKELPVFEWSEPDLEEALSARQIPYRDPVLRIAMHRAHKHHRTTLTRLDFDQAVKRLHGEPITIGNHLEHLLASVIGIVTHRGVQILFATTMTLFASGALLASSNMNGADQPVQIFGLIAGISCTLTFLVWWWVGNYWTGACLSIWGAGCLIAISIQKRANTLGTPTIDDIINARGFGEGGGTILAFGGAILLGIGIITLFRQLERAR